MAGEKEESKTIINHDIYGVGRAATALAIAAAVIGVFGFVTNNIQIGIQIGATAGAPPRITSTFNGRVSACPQIDNAANPDAGVQVVTVGNQKYAGPVAKF